MLRSLGYVKRLSENSCETDLLKTERIRDNGHPRRSCMKRLKSVHETKEIDRV